MSDLICQIIISVPQNISPSRFYIKGKRIAKSFSRKLYQRPITISQANPRRDTNTVWKIRYHCPRFTVASTVGQENENDDRKFLERGVRDYLETRGKHLAPGLWKLRGVHRTFGAQGNSFIPSGGLTIEFLLLVARPGSTGVTAFHRFIQTTIQPKRSPILRAAVFTNEFLFPIAFSGPLLPLLSFLGPRAYWCNRLRLSDPRPWLPLDSPLRLCWPGPGKKSSRLNHRELLRQLLTVFEPRGHPIVPFPCFSPLSPAPLSFRPSNPPRRWVRPNPGNISLYLSKRREGESKKPGRTLGTISGST